MSDRFKVRDELSTYLRKKSDEYVPQTSEDPDDNECDECSMSETMHRTFPKNTCGNFTKRGGLTSHDGEARKDGWKSQGH